MKKYFFTIVATFCNIFGYSQQKSTSLNVEEFEAGIAKSNSQLLDVRTIKEYKKGHLKNALQANFNNPDEFKERVQSLNKNNPVYVYCLSGIRSDFAITDMQKLGFTAVFHLKGGINAWKKQNRFVEGTTTVEQFSLQAYEAVIQKDSLVLVNFGAEWCPPCVKMEPILERLAKEIPAIKVFKVDGSIHLDIMKEMQIESLPVYILYKNGQLIWRKQGLVTVEEFKSVIENKNKL